MEHDIYPVGDGVEVIFGMKGHIYVGWFRKRHECHGKGLFGCYVDELNKDYFLPEEIDWWKYL